MKRVYCRKEAADRPIKMSRLAQIEQPKEMDISKSGVDKIFNKDDTKIVTKEYVLNDAFLTF